MLGFFCSILVSLYTLKLFPNKKSRFFRLFAEKKKKTTQQRPPVTHGTISSSPIYKQFKWQEEREDSGAGKKKLGEIITENFPNLMKNINPQINTTKKNKLKQKQKPNYSYPRIC